MENINYIIYAFAGLLGVILHCLCKAKDLIEYANKANLKFSIIDYFKKDWFSVSTSLLSVIVWLLIFGEVGAKYPKILDYIICSFIGMGFLGSYIIQKFFSKGKAYISDIIDKKTNIADGLKAIADAPDDGPGGSNPPPVKGDK